MNYYKILNEFECHNSLQYKTGLNIDPEPFNPSGNCTPGGIYFAREDILAFLDYGPWIRKVTIPEDARVYENPGRPKKWKADKIILGERRKIDVNVIKELINEGANIHADNEFPLRWAVENNYPEIVKLLIDYGANIHIEEEEALITASINGYFDIVKLLVDEGADIHIKGEYPLIWSIIYGYTDIVKLLVENGVDIHIARDYPIQIAIEYDHREIIKYLIKHPT